MKRLLSVLGSVTAIACVVATPAHAAGPPDAVKIANGAVAVARGSTLLHTNTFGRYGCEDFVDAAYGRTTANGIPHDGAMAFYHRLAARGEGHSRLPAPLGALVFSQGEDGDHVDISMGNGQYMSGGVQGFGPGWGDGTNNQILPSANLGHWHLVGWAFAPWSATGF
ncbi:C40 family peptidase [Streptomyces sp. SID6673]|nr:C40 family peptidase [Streptomyces sp. SID11726]NEB26147.1 C40 family peptidase [Streptomyces sp. SID6673]